MDREKAKAVASAREAGRPAPTAPSQVAGKPILAFVVAGQRFGLPVDNVVQIIEMVALTPLPGAPDMVRGVLDFHGQVIPAIDMRLRLGLPQQAYTLRTPIVIGRLGKHLAGLIVDAVSGVVGVPEAQIETPDRVFSLETLPSRPLVGGVARQSDGLLLILDLGAFLSRREERALKQALVRLRGQ